MNFKYLKLENIEDVLIPLTGTNQKNASLCRGAYIDEKKEFYENSGEILKGLIREKEKSLLEAQSAEGHVETPPKETEQKYEEAVKMYKKELNKFYNKHLEVLNDLLAKKVSGYSFLELGENGKITGVRGEKTGPVSYTVNPTDKDRMIAAGLVAIGDNAVEKIEEQKDYAALALKAYALSGNFFVTKNTAKKFLEAIQDDRTVGEEVMGLVRLGKNGRRHCEKKMDKIKEILGEEAFYQHLWDVGNPLTLTLSSAVRNWSD